MKQISYDYSYIKGGSMLPLGKATAQGKLNLKKLAWPSLPRTYTHSLQTTNMELSNDEEKDLKHQAFFL